MKGIVSRKAGLFLKQLGFNYSTILGYCEDKNCKSCPASFEDHRLHNFNNDGNWVSAPPTIAAIMWIKMKIKRRKND